MRSRLLLDYRRQRRRRRSSSVIDCVKSIKLLLPVCAITIVIIASQKNSYNKYGSSTQSLFVRALHTVSIITRHDWARYTSSTTTTKHQHHNYHQLNMVVTPTGPFCPFRSDAAIDVEPKVEGLNELGPDIALDMDRLRLDLSTGTMPQKEQLLTVAQRIEAGVDVWENLLVRFQLSKDFQTKEYAKLTLAHLENSDMTITTVASMMRWQAGCMRAMANNSPPPLPPPGVNLEEMIKDAQETNPSSSSRRMFSTTAMTAAQQITTPPFTGKESAFESTTVKDEYEQLCRDHNNLIQFGSKYDDFDPTGKLLYLDEIDKIHERWDIFFTRFQLLGVLNKDYIKQCNDFLFTMNMTEDDYRKLLKQCHEKMRSDAEIERLNQFASSSM